MAGFGKLKILGGNGHTTVTWPLLQADAQSAVGDVLRTLDEAAASVSVEAQAAVAEAEAERIFLSAVKGPPERMAYRVDPATGEGSRITEFDATAEEIIVIAPMAGGNMDVEGRRAMAFQFAYQVLRDAAQADGSELTPGKVLALAEKVDGFLRGTGVPGTAGQVEVEAS